MTPGSRRMGLAAACALVLAAGCGSDSGPQKPAHKSPSAPAVTRHVVAGETFLGFPRLGGVTGAVQKEPEAWVSASPFPFYADMDKAAAEMRRDGFVAGVFKIFKKADGVGSAGSIAVEMRNAAGAEAEIRRQLAQARALPCPSPDGCKQMIERFAVPGVPGAIGIDLKSTLARPTTEDGVRFRGTHDLSIVFAKGPFAHQLFAGGPGMDKKRDELIAAATALARRL